MKPVWHRRAMSEFLNAVDYYDNQEEGLGARFADHVDAAIQFIDSDPLRPRCIDDSYRKMPVRKFPYLIIYEMLEDEVKIVAISHTSRRPGSWRSRLSDR